MWTWRARTGYGFSYLVPKHVSMHTQPFANCSQLASMEDVRWPIMPIMWQAHCTTYCLSALPRWLKINTDGPIIQFLKNWHTQRPKGKKLCSHWIVRSAKHNTHQYPTELNSWELLVRLKIRLMFLEEVSHTTLWPDIYVVVKKSKASEDV